MKKSVLFFVLFLMIFSLHAQNNHSVVLKKTGDRYILENQKISLILTFKNGQFSKEQLKANIHAKKYFKNQQPEFTSDGSFALNINWTGWRAPHKVNNAENPVILTAKDFILVKYKERSLTDGGKQLSFFLKGINSPFIGRLSYRLSAVNFWVTKQFAVMDTTYGFHFLRFIFPFYATVQTACQVKKNGGFGQPVVLRNRQGGFFCGLEYPAATNKVERTQTQKLLVTCGVEVGQKIGGKWITSPWTVLALTPSHSEKLWFDQYLTSQRVLPLRPYILYNSWYDLRSAEYPHIPKKNVMNENNVLRIIDLIKRNFVQKNGIHLDAFVLDDGWDVYDSDWILRPKQFPQGLKPIADRLKKMNTNLGLWFGPTGGYSFRMRRIKWMGAHGYEVIAKGTREAMMCVAGRHYSQLLKKRTTNFVQNAGVGFFKWDGIQFSCSEPDHGHPIGIYSQRAVMDTVISLCNAVRAINPDIFLNITSGTWLSPWWVKYANQIWMGGGDYGYSNIPSISRRDAAITYRDITLFQDFNVHKFWFPIANLMTHGIIKGQLQNLGGEQESIDKFTDNALLYFARGVSMWELYISPDILTNQEWKAISQSIKWAKSHFDLLKHTFMLGGNPANGKAYAYVHFNGSEGIVAVRNPFIKEQMITIPLADTLGLDPTAHHLVLEQVYPVHRIFPDLYKAGQCIKLKAKGYQAAVYQIFPLEKAQRPLVANIIFSSKKINDKHYQVQALAATGPFTMLNPNFVKFVRMNTKKVIPLQIKIPSLESTNGLKKFSIGSHSAQLDAQILLKPNTTAQFAILMQQTMGNRAKALPQLKIEMNGRTIKPKVEDQGGKWAWIKVPVQGKSNKVKVAFLTSQKSINWQGVIQVWLLTDQILPATKFVFETRKAIENEILPPLPRANNVLHKNRHLGTFEFASRKLKEKK